MQNTEEIWRLVDAKKDDFEALSDRVWGMFGPATFAPTGQPVSVCHQ